MSRANWKWTAPCWCLAWLLWCARVYIYIRIYVYMYIYIYISIHMYVYMFTYIHICRERKRGREREKKREMKYWYVERGCIEMKIRQRKKEWGNQGVMSRMWLNSLFLSFFWLFFFFSVSLTNWEWDASEKNKEWNYELRGRCALLMPCVAPLVYI